MNEMIIAQPSAGALLPVIDIDTALQTYEAMRMFVKRVLKDETDFGVVPGTGSKPTLLKPGAEKLARFFGLSARFSLEKDDEDWETPFFNYRYKCSMHRLSDGALVAEGEGSCNSRESKYFYRQAQRVCPTCGKTAIIKGKEEYGGGWICFAKKGGCGAKFKTGDSAIEGQQTGQVINPDIPDLVNTLQKMAQKRALIAATLIATNASDYFTQDIEDLNYHVEAYNPASRPNGGDSSNVEDGEEVPPSNGEVTDLLDRDMSSLEGRDIYRVREYSVAHSDTGHEKHWQNRYAAHFERTPMNKLAGLTVAEFLEQMSTPSSQTEQEPF